MIVDHKLTHYLWDKCIEHNKETYNSVELGDIIYSYTYFETNGFNWDDFHVTNDWDEGESNDPFWDKELNMHSAESFILKTCKELKILNELSS
jgi:hypothetical protein